LVGRARSKRHIDQGDNRGGDHEFFATRRGTRGRWDRGWTSIDIRRGERNKFGELADEDLIMTEEQPKKAPRSAEETKLLEQKRELRGLREKMKTLRERGKALSAEREETSARYKALAQEMGLPPRKSKSIEPDPQE
jgi:hypothetical protein